MEIRHLTQGVGTGIRPAAAGDLNILLQHPGKDLFNFSLHGGRFAGKPLPSPVAGAIVANVQA